MTGRAIAAVVLALASVAPALAASSAPPVVVEFSGPARLDGALDSATGQWALLIFRDSAGGAFPLGLDAGSRVVHHTAVKAAAPMAGFPLTGGATPEQRVEDPALGRLVFPEAAWASLYVEADRVTLETGPLNGTLGPSEAGANADGHLPADLPRGTAIRPAAHQVAEDGAAVALRGDSGPFRVVLRATGLRLVEWHNATMDCAGRPCDAFASPAAGLPRLPGAQVLGYVEVFADGGDLEAASTAFLAVAGGPSLDLAVNGSARLPQASVRADCGGQPCPDPAGGTLGVAGSLLLQGVRPAGRLGEVSSPTNPGADGGGRLQASLSGAFDARIDEAAAPGLGRAVAAAAVAAVAVPLLIKAALALFARSARPPALRHPKRRLLYEMIRAEPGQSFRGLQRRTGWQNGTLSNHMARLADAHLVVSRRYRNTVRYFSSDGPSDGAWTATVVLSNPELRKLHGWLLAHPGSTQGAVIAQGESVWGWRRSTTQDRLRTLLEGRLAEARRHGRKLLYSALPEPAAGPSSPWTPRLGFAVPASDSFPAAAAAGAQSATVSPSSTGGSFLATSHTPANTSAAAGRTFQSSGASSTT